MNKKISELTNRKFWLAPLAGYTDQPFRRICKEWGADVMVSEMVSADGVTHNQRQTLAYVDFTEIERPFGVQLFGSHPLIMAKAAAVVAGYKPDFIDLNMGCPVKKVIKRGAGGALMSNLNRATDIVREVRNAMPVELPLSVKFRSGADLNHLNYLDLGTAVQDAGADFVALHPRTVKQAFTGESNWQHIRHLKERLEIPVIGNGDVKSAEDAMNMFEQTGCDSIMIGRGVLGHPWLFSQIRSALTCSPTGEIDNRVKYETLIRHIDHALELKPERLVVRELRSHLCFYTKGLPGSARLRDAINHTESVAELKKILTEAFVI